MTGNKSDRIPTNLVVGFLGSGKTTAISKLIDKSPNREKWSILVNEFGVVSIDQTLLDSRQEGIAVEELGGGCACCTLAFAFQPLLKKFLERTTPDRLILEPSGVSHPAKVVDILRSSNFAESIELRNIICLIDPKDAEDVRWRESPVFQDQIQLADIVVLNWTDVRDRELIDRCREWVESFRPSKQLIIETSFGEIDPALLDMTFDTVHFPMFVDAHPTPERPNAQLPVLNMVSDKPDNSIHELEDRQHPLPGIPLRFQNDDPDYDACGWIFHHDDIFDRDELLDLLGFVHPIVRLKGVFRCEDDWWTINRAKDGTRYSTSAYRRDSRLEIILEHKTSGWSEFEVKLLECLSS